MLPLPFYYQPLNNLFFLILIPRFILETDRTEGISVVHLLSFKIINIISNLETMPKTTHMLKGR